MKETVKAAIKTLAGKSEKTDDATDALKFSQAALDLAHVDSVQTDIDLRVNKVPATETYQERVITEKKDLDAKREALENFFRGVAYSELSQGERGLLIEQHRAMSAYAEILYERISAF